MSSRISAGFPIVAVIAAVVPVWHAVITRAQPVTLVDERSVYPIIENEFQRVDETDVELLRLYPGAARVAPDGQSLLYMDPPGLFDGDRPAQLVILRLASLAEGKERTEFRPDLGPTTASDLSRLLMLRILSPDGKLMVSPDYSVPPPRGGDGVMRQPLLVCQLETGKAAKSQIAVDVRYADIDHTGKVLLDMDGKSFSLVTGKPARAFGYRGHVDAANPAAPIVAFNTGVERRPGPWHVYLWNLRENKLLAALPHNEKFKYSDKVQPVWTSDGTYVYFADVVGETFNYAPGALDDVPHVTRVWNVKTRQLVGGPLPWSNWRKPGPRVGTMILSVPPNDDAERFILHNAETGATADVPVRILDAGGDKVAYVKAVDGKPHVCIATLQWGADVRPGAAAATKPKADATKPQQPRPR